MTEEQEKIFRLEQELEKLSLQLDQFRRQIKELKGNVVPTEPVQAHRGDEDNYRFKKDQPDRLPNSVFSLENFIGLKLLHLTGIVVLVIGISIGVKYAVDKELISPTARIALAYTAGLILYLLSQKLKRKFELFSAILFSGAMASLYFTSYAAFVYYQLFSLPLTFGIMAAITFFTVYNALRYDKQEIAILGMTGAYAIPFLISANADRADLYFAYIILINSGIVFLSYKKEWKAMVRLAMLASWTLFIGWAFSRYEPTMQTQAIAIMTIFYLLFSFASLVFVIKKKEPIGMIELQLFLLNSILAFAASLLVFTGSSFDDRAILITGIAFVVFTVQAVLAKLLLPEEKLLFNYLVAFAILCLVFYVGMKWDGLRVTMTWIAIAAVLFTSGVLAKAGWLRLLAILLTGVTLGKLILVDRSSFSTEQKIISYIAIGVLLLLLSFFYQKFKQKTGEETSI